LCTTKKRFFFSTHSWGKRPRGGSSRKRYNGETKRFWFSPEPLRPHPIHRAQTPIQLTLQSDGAPNPSAQMPRAANFLLFFPARPQQGPPPGFFADLQSRFSPPPSPPHLPGVFRQFQTATWTRPISPGRGNIRSPKDPALDSRWANCKVSRFKLGTFWPKSPPHRSRPTPKPDPDPSQQSGPGGGKKLPVGPLAIPRTVVE